MNILQQIPKEVFRTSNERHNTEQYKIVIKILLIDYNGEKADLLLCSFIYFTILCYIATLLIILLRIYKYH